MKTWDSKTSVIIIPPWLEHRSVWLEPLFDPQKWEKQMWEMRIDDLSIYSYDKESVTIRSCSLGGGFVVINNVAKPWVMLALMNRSEIPRQPRGLPRTVEVGVSVVIPHVLAGARLGVDPVPLAPGPLISIECPQNPDFVGVAFVAKKAIDQEGLDLIRQAFLDYGLQAEQCPDVDIENNFKNFVDSRKMRVCFFQLSNSEISSKELFAISYLAGLLLATRLKSLFSMHLLAKIDGLPSDLRYAAQWSPGAKSPRKADDW